MLSQDVVEFNELQETARQLNARVAELTRDIDSIERQKCEKINKSLSSIRAYQKRIEIGTKKIERMRTGIQKAEEATSKGDGVMEIIQRRIEKNQIRLSERSSHIKNTLDFWKKLGLVITRHQADIPSYRIELSRIKASDWDYSYAFEVTIVSDPPKVTIEQIVREDDPVISQEDIQRIEETTAAKGNDLRLLIIRLRQSLKEATTSAK